MCVRLLRPIVRSDWAAWSRYPRIYKTQASLLVPSTSVQKHYVSQNDDNVIKHRCFQTSCNRDSVFENKDEKAVAIWSNVKALKASPLPALTLGFSGLIPFVAAPLYIVNCGLYIPDIAFAQLAYGATILSFLGGVRWGFTIPEENPVRPDWVNLGYSVIPSLVAWCGLIMPEPFSFLTVIGGLTFAAYCDMAMYGYPPWFKGLRFLLSFIAVLSLWTTLVCKYILCVEAEKKDSAEKDKDKS